jgi:hypothetical protein
VHPGPGWSLGERSRLDLSGREQKFEGGSLAQLAVESDGALVTAHDPQDRGEPQAPAAELGGEEGLEETTLDLLVHAAAGVGHFQGEVQAWA